MKRLDLGGAQVLMPVDAVDDPEVSIGDFRGGHGQ